MAIQNLSERALLITLPGEPHLSGVLEIATRLATTKADRDIVVDFSQVQIMPSATICSLMILHRMLTARGCQFILCSIPANIMGVFARVGLHNLFTFAGDQAAALRLLQDSDCLSR